MSGIGAAAAGPLAFFGHGDFSLNDLVKNQGAEKSIDSLINDYQNVTSRDSTDLNSYINDYLSGNASAKKNAAQETDALDQLYNGGTAEQLQANRLASLNASNTAANEALAYNRGNLNRSLINGGGSDSSYAGRAMLPVAAGLYNTNLQNELGNERSDIMGLTQAQLGNVGKRSAIQDALAGRDLVPATTAAATLGSQAQGLGAILAANDQNNMFGAQYNPSPAEVASNAITASSQGL